MENHIADPLDLTQLATLSGVSARQLNRLFSEKLEQTTMQFYRDMRLEKARNLIANSPLKLTEIALATGFSNSAHFSSIHSKRYGVPPSTLRKPEHHDARRSPGWNAAECGVSVDAEHFVCTSDSLFAQVTRARKFAKSQCCDVPLFRWRIPHENRHLSSVDVSNPHCRLDGLS